MLVYGMMGNNGAGKDTFAKMLQEELETKGIKVVRKAFADKLYEICEHLFGTPSKELCDQYPILKEHQMKPGVTVRDTLIKVGAYMRETDPDCWVNFMKKELDDVGDVDVVLLTDVRFQNEADMCYMLYELLRTSCKENVGIISHDVLRRNVSNDRDLTSLEEEAKNAAEYIFSMDIIGNRGGM